jgi:hypothetical protein
MDQKLEVAKGDAAGDPGQRLPREAPLDERVEERVIVAGSGQELVCLLVGGDEPRAREGGDQRAETVQAVQTGRPRKER